MSDRALLTLPVAQARPRFRGIPADRLEPALRSANGWVVKRIRWDDDYEEFPPPALVQAVELMTARYLSRESSPDGFVGMQETGGVAYIGRIDRDVESLIGPYRPGVLA